MQSMFMLKREKNMVTSKGCNIAPETNAYERCMKIDVVLSAPLLWINDYKRHMERGVVKESTVWQISEKLLIGVVGKVKRRLIDQERMRGLAKVN
jgi:hypothetical protein